MNEVPPFPIYTDSTMLATYKSCPIKFWRTYCQHWKSKGKSVHLVAGKAFAKGLEVTRDAFYVQKADAESAVSAGLMALIKEYGDFECPPDSAKSLERMCGAFEFYWDNYPLNTEKQDSPIILPSGRHGIEFSFSEPLPIAHPITGDPIIYTGRMDAICNYAGGIYIIDEKTTSSLGASWSRQWDLRGQFTGYAWACKQSGIKVDGALIRGVSILKTKYDTLQAITYRAPGLIDRWYNETCRWIERMVEDYKNSSWLHNYADSCADYGGCAFLGICSTPNPEPWLETNFERRVWNPVLHEEILIEAAP